MLLFLLAHKLNEEQTTTNLVQLNSHELNPNLIWGKVQYLVCS